MKLFLLIPLFLAGCSSDDLFVLKSSNKWDHHPGWKTNAVLTPVTNKVQIVDWNTKIEDFD